MDNIRLACAACRILCFRLFNRMSGRQPPPPKPQKHVVCLGLTNSGKSAALALVAGEPIDKLEPTQGFHVKDIQLTDCLLNVKELGGSEKIREYWHHYYQGAQGVIFVVDGAGKDEELATAREVMVEALKDDQLVDLPILLLVTHQDAEATHPKSANELTALWELRSLYKDRITVYGCSIKHINQLRTAFNTFGSILVHGVTSPDDVELA